MEIPYFTILVNYNCNDNIAWIELFRNEISCKKELLLQKGTITDRKNKKKSGNPIYKILWLL